MKVFKLLLITLGVFIVAFAVCAFFGLGYVVSAIFAVIISLCITYLFFNKQRKEANEQLAAFISGTQKKSPTDNKTLGELQDNDYEDSVVAAAEKAESLDQTARTKYIDEKKDQRSAQLHEFGENDKE